MDLKDSIWRLQKEGTAVIGGDAGAPNAHPKETSICQLALLSQKSQEGENEVEIKENKGNE